MYIGFFGFLLILVAIAAVGSGSARLKKQELRLKAKIAEARRLGTLNTDKSDEEIMLQAFETEKLENRKSLKYFFVSYVFLIVSLFPIWIAEWLGRDHAFINAILILASLALGIYGFVRLAKSFIRAFRVTREDKISEYIKN